jgi:hypothetical protein
MPDAADPKATTLAGRERVLAIAMGVAVAIDAVLGIGAIIAVPYHRHTALVPSKGSAVYGAHALLGALLAIVALAIIPRWSQISRTARVSALTGCIGLAVAGLGGILTVFHPTRLFGMVLMLLGWVAAETGYFVPAFDEPPPPPGVAPSGMRPR